MILTNQGLSNALMSLEKRQHKHQERFLSYPQSQRIVSKLLKITVMEVFGREFKKSLTVNIKHIHSELGEERRNRRLSL